MIVFEQNSALFQASCNSLHSFSVALYHSLSFFLKEEPLVVSLAAVT